MIRSETYQAKFIKLTKQYELYDQFLQDPETELTFQQRQKLIEEMGRLIYHIKKIGSMPMLETRRKTDDYPLVLSSSINFYSNPLEHVE